MALADQLRENLVSYWNFEQDTRQFNIWDQAHGGNHLEPIENPLNITGKVGLGVQINALPTPQGLHREFTSSLSHQGQEFTYTLWFKPTVLSTGISFILMTNGEYGLTLVQAGTNYFVQADIDDVTLIASHLPIVVGQWYFVAIGWNGEKAFLSVNLGNNIDGLKSSLPINTGGEFQHGNSGVSVFHKLDAVLDEAGFWRGRSLTREELEFLFNQGNGRTYTDFFSQPCDTIECCPPDDFAHKAAEATDSGTCTNIIDNPCTEIPVVTISPPNGAIVMFPTWVILTSNVTNSIIRYTLDGTTPDENSTIYTGAFQITGSGTVVRAFAQII